MSTSFTLFGTVTSPFVRRVRIVALEKGVSFSLVDTNTPEGQAALRALSPVWKVPAARFGDGTVVWDSRVILDVLTRDGWGPLRAPPRELRAQVDEENVVNAIDEALLALIRRFYMTKDGASVAAPFFEKDRARVDSLLDWIAGRVRGPGFVGAYGAGQGFGRAELALVTALGWMRFRHVIEVDRWPQLVAFERTWAERPSVVATRPG